MGHLIYHVDTFTTERFRGNPAAVCVLQEPREIAWMQCVAQEMNLSETAFAWPEEGGFRLHFFTTTTEVKLSGHAALAAAHILWQLDRARSTERLQLQTRLGPLTAVHCGTWIELDLPADPPEPMAPIPALVQALGAYPCYLGRSRVDALYVIDSEKDLRALEPDLDALRKLPFRGICVSCRSEDPRYDFLSRFFAPASGIDEDPVTGSAHCTLGPYWGERLGKTDMVAFQASSRGGTIRLKLDGDRVILKGEAVTVLRGDLLATGEFPCAPDMDQTIHIPSSEDDRGTA